MLVPVPNVILLLLGSNEKFVAVNALVLRVNPPIVPDCAFKTPASVTLNGASAKVESPNCIPVSASAINTSSPLPNVRDLPLVSNVKFVPVNAVDDNVNPPILPPVNNTFEPVICPVEPVITNSLLSENKVVLSILNPPISPDVAVIAP